MKTTFLKGTVDVQGYLKLLVLDGEPPANQCLYTYHRGRMVLDSAHLKLYTCFGIGWVGTPL